MMGAEGAGDSEGATEAGGEGTDVMVGEALSRTALTSSAPTLKG